MWVHAWEPKGDVYQDIHPAKGLIGSGKKLLDLFCLRYVAMYGNGFTPELHYFLHRLPGSLIIDIPCDDVSAVLGKSQRDPMPQSTICPSARYNSNSSIHIE
jgi:hypothetical protein